MTRGESDGLFLLCWAGVTTVMFYMGLNQLYILMMGAPLVIICIAYILSLFDDYS